MRPPDLLALGPVKGEKGRGRPRGRETTATTTDNRYEIDGEIPDEIDDDDDDDDDDDKAAGDGRSRSSRHSIPSHPIESITLRACFPRKTEKEGQRPRPRPRAWVTFLTSTLNAGREPRSISTPASTPAASSSRRISWHRCALGSCWIPRRPSARRRPGRRLLGATSLVRPSVRPSAHPSVPSAMAHPIRR